MKSARTVLRAGIVIILLGFGAVTASPAEGAWVSFDKGAEGLEPLVSLETDGQAGVVIDVTVFGIRWQEVTTKGGSFVTMELPGHGWTATVGEARLPVIRKLVEVPQDATVQVQVESARSENIVLAQAGISHRIVPVQAPVPKIPGAVENAPFVLNNAAYSADRFSPSSIVELGETSVIRGRRVVQVSITPLQYNPVQGEIKAYSRIRFVLRFSGGNMVKTSKTVNRYQSEAFDRILGRMIVNFGQFDPYEASKSTAGDGILIIVPDSLKPSLEPLAEWKRKKGFKVEVAPTSVTGSTTTQIKNYIQSAFDSWSDPALTYVILAGDTDTIPSFSGTTGSHVSDLYYATLSGSDYLPDVWMGRISVATSTQAQTVVSRILQYELANLSSTAWIKDATFIATCDTGWYNVAEGTHNYTISHYMDPRAYVSDKLYCITYGAGTSEVSSAVNAGRSLVTYSGHGSETSWGGPSFSKSNVDALTSGDMTPFVASHACLTGSIQVSECFGEKWLRKAAIGFWGASNSTYWDEDDYLEKGMYKALFDEHLYATGQMVQYGLYYVYSVYGGGGSSKYYFEIYHLLGDPTLEPWTEEPESLTVYHESTIPAGAAHFTVVVQSGGLPVQGAAVSLYKSSDGVQETVLTDSSGRATVVMSPAPATEGSLYVTVTAHDVRPYEGTCTVLEPDGPYLMYGSHLFDDSGGNGDGYANPGEAVVMPVTLANYGIGTCVNAVAAIDTTSPWVEAVSDPTAEYPNIPSSETGASLPPHFTWNSYSGTPDRTIIPFDLEWSCQGGSTGSTLVLVEICADDDSDGFTSCEGDCDDGNGSVNPGAVEVCDGVDNDCDEEVDEGFTDADNDGAAYCVDCDDADPARYPAASEICDGKDNDCDLIVPANETDADTDGYMICENDCDDGDYTVHPGASENCGDGKDNDCDGDVDGEDSECQSGWSIAATPQTADASVTTQGTALGNHAGHAFSMFMLPAAFVIAWRTTLGRKRE